VIAIPAMPVRDAMCVHRAASEGPASMVAEDPVAVAHRWEFYGFRQVHIVDLDTAAGGASESVAIREVLRATSMAAQVSAAGDEQAIGALFRDGASRMVLSVNAIPSSAWLAEMAEAYPGALAVAADVSNRRVRMRDWARTSDRYILDLVEDLNALPLAAVVVTAVDRVGLMTGTDVSLMESVVDESEHPVCAIGGIGTLGDLRALEDRGVASVVIGTALYTGALAPGIVAEEFAESTE
jgi:phosphoribosylformimino-5-aminoimidazole carboxamide ribotide isomerase